MRCDWIDEAQSAAGGLSIGVVHAGDPAGRIVDLPASRGIDDLNAQVGRPLSGRIVIAAVLEGIGGSLEIVVSKSRGIRHGGAAIGGRDIQSLQWIKRE